MAVAVDCSRGLELRVVVLVSRLFRRLQYTEVNRTALSTVGA